MRKKILSMMLTICMVLTLMTQMSFAETLTYGDFEYSVSGDNKVTITEYTGKAEEVEIPSQIDGKQVTAIGESAFALGYSSEYVKKITVPAGITTIGGWAFDGCRNLESIELPGSLISIGDSAFARTGLKSIVIPEGVKVLSKSSFSECMRLESIKLPNSLETIKQDSFDTCISLKSLEIPQKVTSIEDPYLTFFECLSIENITVASRNTSYTSENGVLFNKDKTRLLRYPANSSLESYEIPASVSSIDRDAFMFSKNLKSVTIPRGVTTIDEFTFSECEILEEITIPDTVTSIGEQAFSGCQNLRSVVLPDSVASVEWGAFGWNENLDGIFTSAQRTISFGDNAVPGTTSRVKYMLDTNKREAYITEITLGSGKSKVDIPEKICGYPVTEVAPDLMDKVGTHKCAGESATCRVPQVCGICGKTFSPHSYTQENKNLSGALKSAGDCQTEATYYYSCIHCNSIEGDDNHTFKGDKDSDKHTGSTVWKKTETQHKQYWNCCNADETDYENHAWNDGKCTVCDYSCTHKDENRNHDCDICGKTLSGHTGGTATCTKQAVCSYCEKTYGDIDSSNHDLGNIRAKEATVTETGNIEYWQCKDCDKCFVDENGTDEISLEETVIRKLQPEIIDGVGQSVIEGSKEELVFRSNAAFSDFIRVELDGTELDESCYTKEEGSTVITLDADFVSTLEAGEHTIGIVSDGGTAETAFVVEEAPAPSGDEDGDSMTDKNVSTKADSAKTGDDTSLALWIALILLSAAGAGGAVVLSRRKR